MELSGLSLEEMVSLKATLVSFANPEQFDCGRCLGQFDDIRDVNQRNEMLQRARAAKACEGRAAEPRHYIADRAGRRIEFSTCIGNWVRPVWNYWQEAYSAYQRGILPFAGGLADQPAKAMDILTTIGAYEHQRMLERVEEEKARNALPGKGRRGKRGG